MSAYSGTPSTGFAGGTSAIDVSRMSPQTVTAMAEAANPTAPMTTEQRALLTQVGEFLRQAGLGNLFSVDANGVPSGWLWDTVIVQGLTTVPEIQMALEGNTAYRERFAPIFEQREQAARGEPVTVMTAADLRAFEEQGAAAMRFARMPSSFYDSYTDFQNLARKGISIDELRSAIQDSYTRVAEAPSQVREWFANKFGLQGDAMIAAYYLDPEHINANLDKISRAAYAGGMANLSGLGDLSMTAAENIASLGYGYEQIRAGVQQTAAQGGLYTESIGEGGTDVTGAQGLAEQFGTSATDALAVQRRRAERTASTGEQGGALYDRSGVLGLKEAR